MKPENVFDEINTLLRAHPGWQAGDLYRALKERMTERHFYRLLAQGIEQQALPNILLCYCGHDCSRCLTFLATLEDNADLRQQVTAFYRNTFHMELEEAEVFCLSGHSEQVMKLCRDCPWMTCAKSRNLVACSACGVYPCQPLADYMEAYVNKCNQAGP